MRPRALLAIAVACAACGHTEGTLPSGIGEAALATQRKLPTTMVAPVVDPSPAGLPAHLLVNVPDQGIGPILARRGDVVLAAWVGTSSEGKRRVVALPLATNGEPRGEAKVVAQVPTDATSLVVQPSGGARPGFIAAWTALTDRGEALSVVGVHDDGRPRGEAIEIARTHDDVVWVGVAPARAGSLVVWVEQGKDPGADVLAAALDQDGALRGVPARVARGVAAWQLVTTKDGAGLALAKTPDAKKGSDVTWLRLDGEGRPSAPIVIASGVHVGGDVDAAPSQGGALIAWTDVSQPDPQPMIARVDDAGRVTPARRASEGGAGGRLVAVATDAIAWEEPFRRGSAGRRVYLARVAAAEKTLDVKRPVPLELEGRGDPEIAKAGDGLAMLAPARACATATDSGACEDGPVLPTFVRFDATLDAKQVEPLRMNVLRETASLGWSLSCGDRACLALAVSGEPPRVSAVDLAPRASGWRAPIAAAPPAGSPLIAAIDTVQAGTALADVAAARLGDGAIVATLSTGSLETKRDDASSVTVRPIAAQGALEPLVTIAKRALPVGGVAIAGTGKAEDGAAVAWVARDAGDPQVHVTRVDRHGKVLRDVQLTNAKGDASDVAIAWGGEKWIVAWVDGRDGNGEVYATTLDKDARDVGKGQRITNAPGDASDVTLLATDGTSPASPERGQNQAPAIWIAWADPRESPQDGFADVYVAPLNATNATRAAEEQRVLATAAHSRSPSLAARGKDVAVAWIEEAPMGADPARARSYGAMLAWLGPNGRPRGEPSRLPLAGDGFPTAITLDGDARAAHAVLARAAGEGIVLDAEAIAPGEAPRAYPLLTLDGPPSLDVAIAVVRGAVFWNDEGEGEEAKRARRATVRWGE